MYNMKNPFLLMPWDATDEVKATLAEQARREGRELLPGPKPSPYQLKLGLFMAERRAAGAVIPRGDTRAFLARLDDIADGRLIVE